MTQIGFTSIEQRNTFIVNQRQKGISAAAIAEELEIDKRTVERVYSRYLTEGRVDRRPGSGRRQTLSPQMKRKIHRYIRGNSYLTCQDIADRLDNIVGAETIRLYLRDQGFASKKPSGIPNLSREDKEIRLEFAEDHIDMEFDTTFFTDECMFTLNGCTKVWGKISQRVNKPKSSFPDKIMVWGAISVEEKAYLEVV